MKKKKKKKIKFTGEKWFMQIRSIKRERQRERRSDDYEM